VVSVPRRSSRKINALFLINSFTFGGAENVIFQLAQHLDRQKYRVCVCAFRVKKKSVLEAYRRIGVRTFDLGMTALHRIPFGIKKLLNILREEEIHILYNFLTFPMLLGAVAGRIRHVPVILGSEHTTGTENRFRFMLKRFAARFIDEITACSETVRNYGIETIGYLEPKLTVIYNGVDCAKFGQTSVDTGQIKQYHITSGTYVIGSVGRLTALKGYIFLLHAFREVKKRHPNIKLLLVGDGEEKSELQRFCRQYKLESDVIFAGYQARVEPFFGMMNLFALPSFAEGFPVSLLEASAAGAPMIATDVGGSSEIVIHEETGLLIKTGDSDQLAQAIIRMIENPDQAAEFSRRAKKRVLEKFSLERMVQETEALFDRRIGLCSPQLKEEP